MKAVDMAPPPIHGLPAEIVDLIVLHLDSQVDMKNLMLASSIFGRSVTEQLYHAPRMQADSLPLALRSARSSVGWQCARSLTILGQLRRNSGCDLRIYALVSAMKRDLVKRMYVGHGRLDVAVESSHASRELHCECTWDDVIQCLEMQVKVERLQLGSITTLKGGSGRFHLPQLACLRSLTCAPTTRIEECILLCRRIVAKAPNLVELNLCPQASICFKGPYKGMWALLDAATARDRPNPLQILKFDTVCFASISKVLPARRNLRALTYLECKRCASVESLLLWVLHASKPADGNDGCKSWMPQNLKIALNGLRCIDLDILSHLLRENIFTHAQVNTDACKGSITKEVESSGHPGRIQVVQT